MWIQVCESQVDHIKGLSCYFSTKKVNDYDRVSERVRNREGDGEVR